MKGPDLWGWRWRVRLRRCRLGPLEAHGSEQRATDLAPASLLALQALAQSLFMRHEWQAFRPVAERTLRGARLGGQSFEDERGIEFALLPWLRERRIPVMAYSPLGRGDLLSNARLRAIAEDIGATVATLVLAWLLHQPAVSAPIIGPRTMEQLVASPHAVELALDQLTLDRLDRIWPGPGGEAPEAYAW